MGTRIASPPAQAGAKGRRDAVPSTAATGQPAAEERGNTFREANDATAGTKGGTDQQEQDIMEAALRLLSESQSYWVKGDVENAIEMLDQAYALILEMNGDPEISRQKDDLRLLITKRTLAIYSAMQSVAKGKRGEIPIIMNADVEKEIRSFQTVERDFFISSYQRSGLYRPYIVEELRRQGLPEELSWLPLVESGYKIKALSTARALGLWQFIPSTGYKYGLERDQWVDERMDPEKATRAAIAYLIDLHGMFGDWLTVLAAYNCGEGRVMRVISRQHINYLDRFWDLYHQLPYETARYVPRFLATIHIVRNPEKYGMDLGTPLEGRGKGRGYETVRTNKAMRLKDVAQHLDVSDETLCLLNPELRHLITPEKEYLLKVPPEAVERFAAVSEAIPHWEQPPPAPRKRPVVIVHRVKRGESLTSIAKRYRTTPKAIRNCNRLRANKGLVVGQHLSIPIREVQTAKRTDRVTAARKTKTADGERIVRYQVKRGDTLSSVATKNNTTVGSIKKTNGLKTDFLKTGQVIRIVRAAGAAD
ncbi:MAG: LysM peptidoglycan-binding domain-containing protein [Pseudomonadota bacterium]|nr:LysM peptidoglycan-binding domain-containing protein [Pseudomonadota bacterium]